MLQAICIAVKNVLHAEHASRTMQARPSPFQPLTLKICYCTCGS